MACHSITKSIVDLRSIANLTQVCIHKNLFVDKVSHLSTRNSSCQLLSKDFIHKKKIVHKGSLLSPFLSWGKFTELEKLHLSFLGTLVTRWIGRVLN